MLQNQYVKALHICLLLIATFHCKQIVGQGSKRNLQQQGQQKQSPERLRKSGDINKYLNVTQDPCNDFYNYACGNWLRYQDVRGAREGDIVSEAGQLEAKVNKQVQRLLTAATTIRDSYAKPVRDFYRSCTQAPANSPAQKQFINRFVSEYGGLPDRKSTNWQPNYNWIKVIGNLKRIYNLDILISLSIRNNRGNKVYLDEPKNTVLPAQYCSAFASQQIEERDQAIQTEIKNNLMNWLDFVETDANRVAGDIMSFEYQLCRNMRKEQMVDVVNNADGQQQLLQNQMNNRWQENKIHGVRRNINNSPQPLQALRANYRLDFQQYIALATGNSMTNEAVLCSEDYFQFLSTIASKNLGASFANYIMYRALSELTFPSNQRNPDSRAAFCAQKVMQFFPEVVGSLYSNMNNDLQADRQNMKRDDVRQIFLEIRNTFKIYMETNMKWLPQTTKRMIQNKVAQLELREPEYMDNAPIQGLNLYPDQNYWENLKAVMMYSANRTIYKSVSQRSNILEAFATTVASSPTENLMQIGSALLQLPLYSLNYPKSLKYSGLGVVLAREMVKKFDQQGWLDNPMGGGNRDPAAMAGFTQNRECFRSQVSNYFFNTPEVYRNGTQLRDIMADSLAVDIAFLAYLNWLDKGPEGPELYMETYADVNFSNTQLFFLNFAQSRCAAKYRDPGTPDFYPLDRHTLERLSINGVLGNGNEFGRDFNCVAGTEMNLGDKCLYDNKNEIKML